MDSLYRDNDANGQDHLNNEGNREKTAVERYRETLKELEVDKMKRKPKASVSAKKKATKVKDDPDPALTNEFHDLFYDEIEFDSDPEEVKRSRKEKENTTTTPNHPKTSGDSHNQNKEESDEYGEVDSDLEPETSATTPSKSSPVEEPEVNDNASDKPKKRPSIAQNQVMTQCAHCNNKLLMSYLAQHAINCVVIQTKEPPRQCKHCQKELPESKSYLHETICRANPTRATSVDREAQIKCPRCQDEVGNYNQLRRHLAINCLPTLIDMTEQSKQIHNQRVLQQYGYENDDHDKDNGEDEASKKKGPEKMVVEIDPGPLGQLLDSAVNSIKKEPNVSPANNKDNADIQNESSESGPEDKESEKTSSDSGIEAFEPAKDSTPEENNVNVMIKQEEVNLNDNHPHFQIESVLSIGDNDKAVEDEADQRSNEARKQMDTSKDSSLDTVPVSMGVISVSFDNHNDSEESETESADSDDSDIQVVEEVVKQPSDSQGSSETGSTSDIGKGNKTGAGSGHMDQCVHCSNFIQHDSLAIHAAFCGEIQKKEMKRECSHCELVQRTSQSLVHEATCSKNMKRTPGKIRCGNCQEFETRSIIDLRSHLATTCLDFLLKCAKENMDNCQLTKTKKRLSQTPKRPRGRPKKRKLSDVNLDDNSSSVDPVPKKSRIDQSVTAPMVEPQPKKRAKSPEVGKDYDIVTLLEKLRCTFCSSSVSPEELKQHILTGCFAIKRLEPQRSCSKCNMQMREAASLFHEAKCRQKGAGGPLKCYNCNNFSTMSSMKSLRSHFVQCLPFSRMCFKKIINEAFKTKSQEQEKEQHQKPKISKTTSSPGPVSAKRDHCHLCKNRVPSKITLEVHLLFCDEVKKKEEKRKCPYCKFSMTLSQSYVHEVCCPRNPTGSDYRNGRKPTTCPKCKNPDKKFKFGSDDLYHHLATDCLTHLKQFHLHTPASSESNESDIPDLTAEPEVETHDDDIDNAEPDWEDKPLLELQARKKPKIKKPHVTFFKDDESKTITNIDGMDTSRVEEDLVLNSTDNDTIADRTNQVKIPARVKKPVHQSVTVNVNGIVKCPFCLSEFQSLVRLKEEHPVFCKGIKKFEPEKTCQHCKDRFPVSISGLHVLICKANPSRMPLTADNLQHCDIHCPECQLIGKAKLIPVHLAKCLTILQKIMENALECNSLAWHQQSPTDYIGKAGLTYWLG